MKGLRNICYGFVKDCSRMQGGKKGFLTTVESWEHACATGHFWWGRDLAMQRRGFRVVWAKGPGNAKEGLRGGLGQWGKKERQNRILVW